MPFVSARDERVRSTDLNFQEEFKPKSTAGEVYEASIGLTIDEDLSISSKLNRESYRERKAIVKGLIESGEIDGKDYVVSGNRGATPFSGGGASTFNYDALSEKYPQVRKDNDLREERNATLKSRRDYANDVFERGPGWARIAGAATVFPLDPVSIATMPIGYSVGAAKGLHAVGNAMLKVGATEMLVETGIQGFVYGHKQDIDSPYSYQEALTNIGTAAFGSALLAGTGMGIKEYISSIRAKTKDLPQSEQLDFADETLARMEDTLSNNPLRKEGMTSKELVEADKEFLTELEVRRTKVEPVQVERKEYAKIDGTPQASSRELSVMDRIGQAEEYKQDLLAYEQKVGKMSEELKDVEPYFPEETDFDFPITHDGGVIGKIENTGVFKGIFGESGISSSGGLGTGGEQTTFFPRKGKVMGESDVDIDYDESIEWLKKQHPDADENEIDGLYDVVMRDKDLFDMESNPFERFGFDDLGEASWEGQKLRGQYAASKGYDAVAMRDETGVSYLLPYGSQAKKSLKKLNDYDEIEDLKSKTPNKSETKTKETEIKPGVSIEIDGIRYDSNEYIKGIDSEIEGIEAVNRCLLG
jgi:hypothetical protein